MAEIIGFDENSKSRITCKKSYSEPGCGAIIAYNRTDIKEYHGKDYSGGSDGREWIVCPNCQKQIILRSW